MVRLRVEVVYQTDDPDSDDRAVRAGVCAREFDRFCDDDQVAADWIVSQGVAAVSVSPA